MDTKSRINEICCRAAALNLTLWQLCELSGARYDPLKRWLEGKNSPTLRVFERETSLLEAKLSEMERTTFERLRGRFEGAEAPEAAQ
jgi:hypothetical protein